MNQPEEKELSMLKLLQEFNKQLDFQDEFIRERIKELQKATGLPDSVIERYLEI